MKSPDNYRFRLASITNEKSSPIPSGIDYASITEETMQFQFKIETIIKFPQNTITVIPAIRFLYEKNIIYEASAEFNYTVIPLDSVMEIDRNNMKLNMKTDVIPGFLSAAYSSLRGIVYARTRATPLEKYPIPLIDTEKLLSKNGFSISE